MGRYLKRPAVRRRVPHRPRRRAPVRAPIRVEVRRGPILESWHEVHGVLWRDGAVVEAWGDAELVTTLRSSWKSIQALPFMVDGVADALDTPDATLAVVAGSHSGQTEHVTAVGNLLARAGLDPSALKCGGHRPYHAPSADVVAGRYGPIHDNCSGKHAAMLAWCRHMDEDRATYLEYDHPVQERVRELLGHVVPAPSGGWPWAVDGCGVPTVAMPLAEIARMFCAVGAAPDAPGIEPVVGRALARVRDAVTAHPLMVAGTGRTDTQVIEATGGRLWTKSGAEGLWAGFERESCTGFAFKAVDGEFRAPVPAALEALVATEVLSSDDLAPLEAWRRPPVKTRVGALVGGMVARVPA